MKNDKSIKTHTAPTDCAFCGNPLDQKRKPTNGFYDLRYCSKTCRRSFHTWGSLERKSKRLRAERGL
jgi:hypothetical protein